MDADRPVGDAPPVIPCTAGGPAQGPVRVHRARLPREARMHKRAEYLEVQSRGLRVHAPHFVLLVLPGVREAFGITVTRKIAGAVGRNRVKRVCREVYRLNRQLFPSGCAVVAVARSGAHELGYAAVQAELTSASAGLHRAAGRGASRAAKTR